MDGDATLPPRGLDGLLRDRLADRARAGLLRRLRRVDSRAGSRIRHGGNELVNVASNDYLGLATHPAVAEAAARAAREWGGGSAASRLVSGSLGIHHELEEAIAPWQGTEAALSFASGFAAAAGTIPALVGPGDVILLDRLAHACCIDAAKASGAAWRPFQHNDPGHLAQLLAKADSRGSLARPRVLIITESVFSMDGDVAPLAEIVALKERHGAWLMLDEAHATGLFGASRAGLAEHLGLSSRVDVHLGTLGKAIGASGGFIAGSRTLVEWLVNSARSFVFSTAPSPAASAAAMEGIRILRASEGAGRSARLWKLIHQLASALPSLFPSPASAILPWMLGDEARATTMAEALLALGFLAPAIRYPTVPRRRARIRLALSSAHSDDDVRMLSEAIVCAGALPAAKPPAGPRAIGGEP